jgi:hypothetical protein
LLTPRPEPPLRVRSSPPRGRSSTLRISTTPMPSSSERWSAPRRVLSAGRR